jgi:hypothetical protein
MMKADHRFNPAALHQNAAEAINRSGVELLKLATRRPFYQRSPDPFPTRQETETITNKDIIGEPRLAYTDITGRTVARYFARDGHEIGLFDVGYETLRTLVERTIKAKPFNKGLSPEFIEESVFDWWTASYGSDKPDSLAEHLLASTREAVGDHHLIIPLSAIEVERAFEIGQVLIAPMQKQLFIDMAATAKDKNPASAALIDKRFSEMANELGHLTAVHVKVFGEPRFAKSHAERMSFQVAEMFRFMSPAALTWNVQFPCFPYGCFSHRTTTVLTIADAKIAYLSQGILDYGMFSWRMTFAELDRAMKTGFANYAAFFEPVPLTSFKQRVGKAISAYSEGVATFNVSNRLIYAMSALEHLLLRNEQEPIQSGVGDRIAFLISRVADERRAIVANFKKAYTLRSKQVHHLASVDDEATLSEFFKNAWLALHRAMQLMARYEKHTDFLDAIEKIKYSGGEVRSG